MVGREAAIADRQFAEALAHHHAGDLTTAEQGYRAVLHRDRRHAGALHLLGVLAHQLDRHDEAVLLISAAVAVDDRPAEPHANLGLALHASGRVSEAKAAYRAALARRDSFPEAHNSLASALQETGDLPGAIRHYRRAIDLAPDYGPARVNLATALLASDQLDEAEQAVREVIRLQGEDASALSVLGVVLTGQGRAVEARATLEAAFRRNPADPEILVNLALAAERTGDSPYAEQTYRAALKLAPDHALARWNLALLLLASGRLTEGWLHYEARLESRRIIDQRVFTMPRWRGEDLTDRHLLVWREQGLGDELLHGTLLPDLVRQAAARAATITVECDDRLISLFQRSYAGIMFVGNAEGVRADFEIAAASLASRLRGTLRDFTSEDFQPLCPDPVIKARWRERLSALAGGLNIGICWRSSVTTGDRKSGYTSLRDWAPLSAVPGINFILLQHDADDAELAEAGVMGMTLHRWDDTDLKNDLESVAALMTELDLVVTAGTAVSELAGAVAAPVWRFGHQQEWTRLGTAVRPWFASMRVFSPAGGQAMADVLSDMACNLRALIPTGNDAARRADAIKRHYENARAQRASGDFTEAEESCRLAVELAGAAADPVMLGLLGALRVTLGQPQAALPVLRRAIVAEPLWPGLYINLARALAMAGPDGADMEKGGIAAWRNALILDPALADCWAALADVCTRTGESGKATELARRALDLRPDDYRLLGHLGRALAAGGEQDRAGWCWWLMIAIDPACAEAFAGLGRLRLAQGRMAAADKALARASRLVAGA